MSESICPCCGSELTPIDEEFLSPSAAARLCNVSAPTIVSWAKKGILPALRTTDGHRIFRQSDVLRIKAERERGEQ